MAESFSRLPNGGNGRRLTSRAAHESDIPFSWSKSSNKEAAVCCDEGIGTGVRFRRIKGEVNHSWVPRPGDLPTDAPSGWQHDTEIGYIRVPDFERIIERWLHNACLPKNEHFVRAVG